jgi:lysophospholipid acyltransferase (LPLAT)-like uncharacterized protein
MFRRFVLPWLAWIFFRTWTLTWRIRCDESPELQHAKQRGDRLIFAHWHGDELCVLPLITSYKIATMISTSKDGQLMDFIVRRLKGATSRGSSTRGGVSALKGLIRLIKDGYRASVAVDGPKGPIYQPKAGVFELSRLAGARIVPVGAATNRSIVFQKSWNKARLPKPFAKVNVRFLEPWSVIDRETDPKDPALSDRLARQIKQAALDAAKNLEMA